MQKAVKSFDNQALARPEDQKGEEVDLFAVARTLWLGKYWVALFVALALAGGYYKAKVASVPLYTATAEMALKVATPMGMSIQSVASGFSGDQASLNTEMSVITSGEMMGLLVDRLNLEQDPEFNPFLVVEDQGPGLMERATTAVRSFLRLPAEEVEGPPPTPEEIRRAVVLTARGAFGTISNWDTYVFTISATSQDREKAALLANTLAQLYRDDQIRLKVESAERMATWLSERVGELRPELEARQSEMAALRARSALVSEESVQALNLQAIELSTQLVAAEGQVARARSRLEELREVQESGSVDDKLAAAQDGQLTAAADALAAGEPGAQLRFDRRFAQIVLQTEGELSRAQERGDELRAMVSDLTSQFQTQSADLLQLKQIEQDAQATQVLYETFLTRLKEASVQSTAYEADSRILTAAAPGRKVSPRSSLIMLMSLMLGLIAGAGFVVGREHLQNTFRTAEDLERQTGRPVVGQVPLIPARNRPDTIRYLQTKPTSAAAEAVRNLRTSILLSDIHNPPQIVMTTSSVPSEGKTTVSISLALNLAGLDKKVLLIEGDIRRCTLDAYFGGTSRQGGILSVVTGKQTLAEAVVRPEGTNIDVLMGEKSSVNAADVFSSGSFERMIQEARQTYDYVVLDTPPVLVVPDARVIAQHVDRVIYVVHWDSTSRSQVESGLRQFRSVNVGIDGLVLSKINPKGMKRYGYGAQHGAYASYGGSYYSN